MRRLCLLILGLLVVGPAFGQSNGWRGIVPLVSTRADVEKVLGKPVAIFTGRFSQYRSGREKVDVTYITFRCEDGWAVSPGTVQSVRINDSSIRGKTSNELGLRENQAFVYLTDLAAHSDWIYGEMGLSYRVSAFGSVVESISYIPKYSDNDKRCNGFPEYAPDRVYFPTQRFRFLNRRSQIQDPFMENIAQFDSIYSILVHSKDYRGWAVVYFDRKRKFAWYKEQLQIVKRFLAARYPAFKPELTFIEGGLRKDAEVEVFLGPRELKPPIPTPDFPSRQFMKNQ